MHLDGMKQEGAGKSNLLATVVAVCPESKAWKQEEITFHINGFLPKIKKNVERKFLTSSSLIVITLQVLI